MVGVAPTMAILRRCSVLRWWSCHRNSLLLPIVQHRGPSSSLPVLGGAQQQQNRALLSSSSTTSSSSSSLVDWHVDEDNKIGTITLRSGETYNALTVEMGREFSSLCDRISREVTTTPSPGGAGGESGGLHVNAIVLTGEGDDAFSAGGNFEWLRSLRNNSVHANADLMLKFYKSFLCVRSVVPVPVIAALQGPAIGAGAGLALACDMRTAAPKKKILGFPFSRLGIHSGMGVSHLLDRALGGRSAMANEVLLTGKTLSGREALELGLVNEVDYDAKGAAYRLAAQVAEQHPVAVRGMLRTIRQRQDEGLERTLHLEALGQAVCYSRGDWGEGVNAIAEKRDPVFDDYHQH